MSRELKDGRWHSHTGDPSVSESGDEEGPGSNFQGKQGQGNNAFIRFKETQSFGSEVTGRDGFIVWSRGEHL